MSTYARTNMSSGRMVGVAAGTILAAGASGAYIASCAAAEPDMAAIKEKIMLILEDNDNLGPTFVRLAWHCSGTYSVEDKTGGSDGGTMRFSPEADHGANAGLDIVRDLLEAIWKAHPEITHADLYAYSGIVAIEAMGGPAIPFSLGRVDDEDNKKCTPDGRLPDGDRDAQHIRDIFYRMGFNDREIVVLSGAHALGRCHTTRSGHWGPWTRAPTTFSNEYFRELLENTWTIKKWDGPEQYEDPTGDLMMLNTDMALIQDAEFKKYVVMYCKDEELFFKDFAVAFQRLTELGVAALNPEAAKPFWKFW